MIKYSLVGYFGVEPELGSESHKTWAFISKCEGYKIYHPDQANEVADVFLNSGAGKFLNV